MFTPADVLAEVRDILQDNKVSYRYDTAGLMRIFNTLITEIRRLRPDAFLGKYTTPIPVYSETNSSVPIALDDMFRRALIDGMVGYAELRDDEFTDDGRAVTMLLAFTKQLTGVGT